MINDDGARKSSACCQDLATLVFSSLPRLISARVSPAFLGSPGMGGSVDKAAQDAITYQHGWQMDTDRHFLREIPSISSPMDENPS